MMEGRVGVIGHKIECVIGDHPRERIRPQELFVDVQVKSDFSRCAKTDRVTDTVDYVRIAEICTELAQKRQYQMLETFAVEALDALLQFPNVTWASILIRKPGAIPGAECSFVELERSR